MLAVHVRLLHGTLRAGSPDDTVLTGSVTEGEWPPSPARLFSALVAADGTRDRTRVTTGEGLAFLEQADPPVIVASTAVESDELCDRYVVKDATASGAVQDYPARSSALVHPGVRLCPREPVVSYVWPEDPPVPVLDGLRARAARIGYLGCADSPVQVQVELVDQPPAGDRWEVDDRQGRALPVPYEGFTAALDGAFDAFAAGAPTRRAWLPTVRQRYRSARPGEVSVEPTVVWLGFDRPVIARRARLVAETLRAAVIDRASGIVGDDAVPWQIHGHDVPEDVARPYHLVRYLSLPDVGYRHSDGAVRGAAIWVPPGAAEAAEVVRAAVFGMSRLHRPGWFDVGVHPHGGEPRPWTTNPQRWRQSSRGFQSVLPVVHDRGTKKAPSLAEVARWFRHAGHPEPVQVRVSPVPTAPGAVWLRPVEVHGTGKTRHPYSWLEVSFDDPVPGPLCIGRARNFGLGLLAPVGGRDR